VSFKLIGYLRTKYPEKQILLRNIRDLYPEILRRFFSTHIALPLLDPF